MRADAIRSRGHNYPAGLWEESGDIFERKQLPEDGTLPVFVRSGREVWPLPLCVSHITCSRGDCGRRCGHITNTSFLNIKKCIILALGGAAADGQGPGVGPGARPAAYEHRRAGGQDRRREECDCKRRVLGEERRDAVRRGLGRGLGNDPRGPSEHCGGRGGDWRGDRHTGRGVGWRGEQRPRRCGACGGECTRGCQGGAAADDQQRRGDEDPQRPNGGGGDSGPSSGGVGGPRGERAAGGAGGECAISSGNGAGVEREAGGAGGKCAVRHWARGAARKGHPTSQRIEPATKRGSPGFRVLVSPCPPPLPSPRRVLIDQSVASATA